MLLLRLFLPVAALFLLGLGIAWLVTRDRKYARLAWRVLQATVVLLVAYGLFFVFSRVLLL